MSNSIDPTLRNLNDCGCCAGVTAETPAEVINRPGLGAIAYRVGTHAQFKESMLARLSGSDLPAFRGLKTRDDDDFSMALLDAWATVADVLTFYQERIANEAYLRTATERLSLLHLARLIGYELRPGVAANVDLAFTVEEAKAPGVPNAVMIDAGTKVQSIPGPGEQPQTFETIEKIEARAEWNALRPQLSEPVMPGFGSTHVYLRGTATNLKTGDALLFVGAEREHDPGSERWDFRLLTTVALDANADRTRVEWAKPLGEMSPHKMLPPAHPKVFVLRQRAAVFGYNAMDWRMITDTLKASYLGLDNPSQLTADDKKEWPDYRIFSPVYPERRGEQIVETVLIQPTVRSVSETVIAAVHEAATKLGHKAAGAAARAALSAAKVADDAAQTASKAADAMSEVAIAAASGLAELGKNAMDNLSGGLSGGLDIVNDAVSGIFDAADPSTIPDDARYEITNALTRVLRKAKDALDASQLNIANVAGTAAQAATGPIAELATLSADALNFVKFAEDTVTEAYATVAATGVAVTSIAIIKAIADDPDTTVDELTIAIRRAAREAPDLAKAGSVAAATAYPELLALPGLTQAAINGGEKIQSALNNALIEALIPKPQTLPLRTPFLVKTADTIDLDRAYPSVLSGGWLVLSLPNYQELYRIDRAVEASRAEFSLTGKTTCVTLNGENLNVFATEVRATTVFAQIEELLPIAEDPIITPVTGPSVTLAQIPEGLKKGHLLVAMGRDLATGQQVREVVAVADISGTTITLTPSLANNYARDSFSFNANVACATHGETKQEVLGSGDASQTYQQFTLKQSPLTYLAADGPSGADSTLQVRVNDLLWQEVPTFYGHGPHERIFVTRTGDDGKTTVEFGDGKTGARLPTGRENVTARYRKGIGTAGNLKAEQLSLLMARPLGVKGVINPEAAAGAADQESLSDARSNAPLTVLTLDRIVSLQDYEDFARAFPGVAKALATWTWTGKVRGVFVTVAGPEGAAIPDRSPMLNKLVAAMKDAGDPHVQLRVQTYRESFFKLGAAMKIDPDYEPQKVLAAVEQALRSNFSFDARAFGQAVTASDVMAVIQDVAGVIAVEVTKFYKAGDPTSLVKNELLLAAVPQAGAGGVPDSQDNPILAAELLTLSAGPLDELGTMT